ncbi:hypothetical protein NDU88_007880 [Pleurodeles waltl]|uniref:Uncharacterized protein n=1 Tax=Pleurodeles waltl TaxID=8319 RepID=A0AAV7N5J0_PLEWA|nr:hypothetical protein NDU88_007880 [Pleurodeles waltl]
MESAASVHPTSTDCRYACAQLGLYVGTSEGIVPVSLGKLAEHAGVFGNMNCALSKSIHAAGRQGFWEQVQPRLSVAQSEPKARLGLQGIRRDRLHSNWARSNTDTESP